ncbi:MAG: glycerol acyltransferase, partial [Marmoricola sp.]
MGDAEIIPIGTRGKPGRGTGSAKPSTSARGLAAKATTKSTQKGARKSTPKSPSQAAKPAVEADPTVVDDVTPASRQVPPPRSPAADELSRPAATTSAPTDHKHPTAGIPAVDWLGGFTNAAVEVFGADWEPRLAAFLAFLRRRLTGDYTVDEYGFDAEITQRFFMTAIRPVAEKWFRIEVRGVENIPAVGGALV